MAQLPSWIKNNPLEEKEKTTTTQLPSWLSNNPLETKSSNTAKATKPVTATQNKYLNSPLAAGYAAIKQAEDTNVNDSADWSNLLKQSANVGAANFNQGMAGLLDVTGVSKLPGIKQFNEWQKEGASKVINDYTNTDKTKAQKIVGDIVSSGVQVGADIPFMLMSTPVKGAQLAATKLPAISNAVKQFVMKPVNIERTATYFGQNYEEAKKDGANNLQATTTALMNAIPSAIIEQAGGLDTVAKKVIQKEAKTGGKSFIGGIIKSALEEGSEEIAQYPLNAMSKSTYKGVPIYSNEEEAVINPKQMGYAGLLGGLAGGVFGGGMNIANTMATPQAKIQPERITAPTNDQTNVREQIPSEVQTEQPTQAIVPMATQEVTTDNVPQQTEQVVGKKVNNPIGQTINENPGGEIKTRKFAQSVMNSDIVKDEAIKNAVEMDNDLLTGVNNYQVLPNKKAVEKAKQSLEDLPTAMKRWDAVVNGNTTPSAYDVALGEQLLTEAAQMKDIGMVRKLVSELALVGTKSGQAVQAFSLLKKLSPEGKLYYIQKFVDNTNNHIRESKEFKGKQGTIKIDDNLIKELLNASTIDEINAAEAKIIDNVADQVPSTLPEKINAYRYLSMLGNVKTHLRNIFGNLFMVGGRKAKNTIGTVLEAPLKTGNKTKAILPSRELKNFASNDFQNIERQVTSGQKYGF
jgi:hypothetical protein